MVWKPHSPGADATIAGMTDLHPYPCSPVLQSLVERALARLRAAAPVIAERFDAAAPRLHRLALASDFAIDTLQRQPWLLPSLLADDGAVALAPPHLDPDQPSEWPALLRRYRTAESTRLIWRDVVCADDVGQILAGATALAERCLRLGLEALESSFSRRFGDVRAACGRRQRLVVFGLGKLGGGELNFSSDIDLVYAFQADGQTDGARTLAAEDYFARLGQQLTKLLDEVTADGFSHRVDMRLRPFGNAGRVAASFAAMESYFQNEGRDWERYAWQKARPVAGDLAAGERLLQVLRPFVYRRYLDYGALDGMREMKALIAAEVARRDLADDIKRGPGGIREIEFLVQALQLIRGGREPELQQRRLLPALHALVRARQVEASVGTVLEAAYRFLRRLENRLQMLADAQTHRLPEDPVQRERIALGLDFPDWSALCSALERHRTHVAAEFAALLAPRRRRAPVDASADYWRALPDGADAQTLSERGFEEAGALDAALRDFARSPGVRGLSSAARVRLDRVMPAVIEAAAGSSRPDASLRRILPLLHNILRRSSYLALLDEQPAALARLIDVVGNGAFLAERVAAHPLLLDELLDARVSGPSPWRERLREECEAAVLPHGDDIEAALQALNERRHALSFRIALATLDGRQAVDDSVRQLAWLADAVIAIVLRLALADMCKAHGKIAGARFIVLGYGSLGGEELGFGSDLDLVFLYDAPADAASAGPRVLEPARWFMRLAQKIVALLGSPTGAGRLYDVDVRLRPDGAKGLLVSTLASYAEYQRERAWTWEHQALVRARSVAGDAALREDFERVRAQVLTRARDADALLADVLQMRRRMRAELDRSDATSFDLKQGEGGLVDLEFLLQYLALRDAAADPAWLSPRATPALLQTAARTGALSPALAGDLRQAHVALVEAGLRCTLDRRPRRVAETETIVQARQSVRSAWRALAPGSI